jgi:glycosyltransferase involved in cell wall biosynthesis
VHAIHRTKTKNRTISLNKGIDASVPYHYQNHTNKKQLAAIIPAYNESLVIGSVVLHTREYVDKVFVIDDGSNDQTAEIARLAGAVVIRINHNQGKANALMYGFDVAQQNGYETVITLDGDGQHDPEYIPQLTKPVIDGKADMVIGSRYLGMDSNIPVYRRIGQVILNFTTNAGSNGSSYNTTDSQSGFRVLNTNALSNLDFKSEGYSIESDMITHLAERDLRITEVPIKVLYNVPHKHKQNALIHGFDVFTDVFGYIGYNRPMILFLVPGIILTLSGLLIGAMAFSGYYQTMVFPFIPTMLSIFTLILGLMLVTSGLVLNSLVQLVKSYIKRE